MELEVNSANVKQDNLVYITDIFLKYKDLNKNVFPQFIRYYSDKNKINNLDVLDFLDKQDSRVKLNYIITKKNISNEDDKLYSIIRYNLNKVNNKMLIPGNDNGLQTTINSLTSLTYTKVEHFHKLSNMLLDKAISEQKFCPIYATLCYELAPYYIEINTDKRVYFRHILLNTCQTTFEMFLDNHEKIDKEKISGLSVFLGELYNKKLLTSVIIKGCFDKMSNMIEKSYNIAEGISILVISTYPTLLKDKDDATCNYFNEKINSFINNTKIHIRSKFAFQNALDKIQEFQVS